MGLEALVDTSEVLIQAAFWLSIAFLTGVSMFWPWWKTHLGWTIWLETAAIAWFVFPSTISLEFGVDVDTITWQWVTVIGLLFVVLILPWRAAAIWWRQRHGS